MAKAKKNSGTKTSASSSELPKRETGVLHTLGRLWKFRANPGGAIAEAILNLVADIPASKLRAAEGTGKSLLAPAARIDSLVEAASWRAAGVAGTLALPAGPLGILTILPSLYSIWKIQAQLVADIAAVHGKSGHLVRESMLYCLFKHGAASALSETVVQAGSRLFIRRVSFDGLVLVAERLGIALSEAALKQFAGRLVPIVGAVAVGAFAKEDTRRVGATARAFFEQNIEIETMGTKSEKPRT